MRNLVLFTSMILSFWGCSNDKDFGGLENIGWNEKPLQITTRILTTKSTNFIQEFKEGSMLGLQITSGTVDDLYNGISTYKNVSVKAYRVNGKIRWQQSPEVILDSNEATIYAYYPYQEDINFNARQIPLNWPRTHWRPMIICMEPMRSDKKQSTVPRHLYYSA